MTLIDFHVRASLETYNCTWEITTSLHLLKYGEILYEILWYVCNTVGLWRLNIQFQCFTWCMYVETLFYWFLFSLLKPDEERPQILISLSYLPSAERLTVVVLKAKNLAVPANKESIGQLYIELKLHRMRGVLFLYKFSSTMYFSSFIYRSSCETLLVDQWQKSEEKEDGN